MGQPKALLPWVNVGASSGSPRAHSRAPLLIECQVAELRAAGVDDIVVVLGHAADEVRPRVPAEARTTVNEAYREGRASSLRAGADALPDDADPILVLNVDQPRPREILRAVLAAHRHGGALITLPAFEGEHGHPPVLAGSLLAELRAVSEESQGLRGVIDAHRDSIQEADLGSDIVLLDINTPGEYREALGQFGRPA